MNRRIKPSSPDTRSVDIDDDYALDFWAKELNVTRKRLKNAVISAGTSVHNIKSELKQ